MADTVVTAKFVADTSSLQSGARKVTGSLQGVQNDVQKSAKGFTMLRGAMGAAFGVAALGAITGAARALTGFATEAVAMAKESQLTVRRLDAIAESMGVLDGVLGGSTQRLTDYAQTLQDQTGVSDETIKSAQALILTFKDVASSAGETGGMFDRTTVAAMDLAAAGFGSIESNAKSLARALQDPTKGLMMLGRQGVTFTEQEKEKIKALAESGRLLEAQEIIMAAVEMQVGGTAAATATSMDKMKASIADVQENLGFGLLPVVEAMASAFQDNVTPALLEFSGNVKENIGPSLARGFEEMVPTILSLAESFLEIAASIRSAMAPAMQVIARLLQAVAPMIDMLAKALSAIPGPVAAVIGALLLLRTAMMQTFIRSMNTARNNTVIAFATMRTSAQTMSASIRASFIAMGTAIKGFMASLGPVGFALIGLAVAFEVFSSNSAAAEQRADEYAEALDELSGAATAASESMVIFNLMQKELGGFLGINTKSVQELGNQAGISLQEMADAVQGTATDFDAMKQRIADAARAQKISTSEARQLTDALEEERAAVETARLEIERKTASERIAAGETHRTADSMAYYAEQARGAATASQGAATGIDMVGGAAEDAADEIDIMRQEYEGWLSVTGQISAVDRAAESIENLGKASVEFGTDLMGQTPKARDFRAEVISAFEDSAAAAAALSDDLPTQRAIFTGELVKIVNSLKASGVKPRDIEAFLGAMDDLPASVSDIMRAAAQAVGDTDFKSEVERAFDKSVKAGAPMTADAMERLAQGASTAAKEKLGLTLEPELASIIKSGTTALRPTAFNNGQLTGKSIGSGLANGITASSPIVLDAVRRVIAAAKAAADAAAESSSPSRLFAHTGDDMIRGVAMGWLRTAPTLYSSIRSIIPRAKGEGSKLAKALASAFTETLAESGGSIASAISSIFGNIPSKTALEVQLGVKGAEKFIKDNKKALMSLVELGEKLDYIRERMDYAGEAFVSLGELVSRPFGRPSQIMEMFGSDADINSVIDGFMGIRDQVTQAYAVLTDASIVGQKAAARNRAEMNRTIATLQNLASQAVQLRNQYDATMKEMADLEKSYQAEVDGINARYDAAEKTAEASIKTIEEKWATAIPKLESALQAATAAFDKENSVLQGLIQQRDQFTNSIRSGFRSFINSLSFESRAGTKQIIRETKRLADGITVTLEREIETGGGPAAIRKTLEERLEAVRAFSRNIRTLMERGLDPTLVQEFVTAGVSGAGEAVAALAAGSQDDLTAINAVQKGLSEEADAFAKYASAEWHDAAIAQREAIVGPLEDARDAAQKALDDGNALREQEIAKARAHLEKLREDRRKELAAAEAEFTAEKARLQAEADALKVQMDTVAAQIEATLLTMINNTAAKSAQAGVTAGKKLLEGFEKEYPGVYRKLNKLMDSLAASLTRTATVTVRTVYEAVMPVTPPPRGKVPKREMGGPVSARTAYLVGERGPELFVPGYSGNIIPNKSLGTVPSMGARGGGSGATNITINVNAGMGTNGAEVGRQIVDSLRQYERRNGPVPIKVSG